MCESCERGNLFNMTRRGFLGTTGLAGAALLGTGMLNPLSANEGVEPDLSPIPKEKAKILLVFMYPPAEVVEEGNFEDGWAKEKWFTYPGNQFQPEMNHKLYKEKIEELSRELDLEIEEAPVIYTKAAVAAFIERVQKEKPDALFVVNFYNTMSAWSYEMAKSANESGISVVVYQPVGSNHQLPPAKLRNAEKGICYIHSVRNWDRIGDALVAIDAKKKIGRTRLLRISNYQALQKTVDQNLGLEIVHASGEEFNALFDSIETTDAIRQAAEAFGRRAEKIIDVRDEYLVAGFRSYEAVRGIMAKYGADAITITCLMLKERKPCIGFSLLNSELVPCACENQWESAVSLAVGSHLFKRGGFMHNPEYDLDRNQYYGAHCTSALKMYGPKEKELSFRIRPFTHQAPKTAALDVRMPEGESAVVMRYLPDKKAIFGYTGKIVGSPEIEVAGGCATRFLMDVDKLDDVCQMYYGPHPILYLVPPEYANRLKTFAKLARLDWFGNV